MNRTQTFSSNKGNLTLTLVVFLTLIHLTTNAADEPVQRETPKGRINGKIVNLGMPELPNVEVYLGIPYGSVPVGDSRFMFSRGAPGWAHIRDGTKFQPVCVQNFPDISNEAEALKTMPRSRFLHLKRLSKFLGKSKQSEDCLYLNIYVPRIPKKSNQDSPPLPVIVLVHGESYEWNAGNPFDGSVLAAYGKVIVVTFNYRLGVLGFLSTGQTDNQRLIRGNFALADIVSAVEMMRSILPHFGGDRERITLLGMGHGAALVHLLMASPLSMAKDIQKFRRAILLGGSGLSPWAISRTPNQYFYLFAQHLGCETFHNHKQFRNYQVVKTPQEVFSCVKSQSVDNLTLADGKMPHPHFLSTWGPVIDGVVVLKDLERHLETHPRDFQRYDLMIGMAEDEAYDQLSEDYVRNGMMKHERERVLRTLVRNLFKYHRTQILQSVLNHYTDWTNPNMHEATIRDKVLEALNDALYVAPLAKTAKIHSAQSANGGKYREGGGTGTYMYLFSGNENDGKKTVTGEHLPYILGYPLLNRNNLLDVPYDLRYNETDRSLSEVMMTYVSNFAQNGDPNIGNKITRSTFKFDVDRKLLENYAQQPPWPEYTSSSAREQYMKIGHKPSTGAFYRADHVAFWNELLPQFNRIGKGDPDDEDMHNFLPQHLDKSKYYGQVYPHGGYFTTPPPPPAPSPPPPITPEIAEKMAKKRKEMQGDQGDTKGGKNPKREPIDKASAENINSSILAITVAVGCAFLILNILVLAGIYHQRDKQRKERVKYSSNYNSYGGGDNSNMTPTPYINLNSPLTGPSTHMPPPPPPPSGATSNSAGPPHPGFKDNDLHPQLSGNMRTFGAPGGHHHDPPPMANYGPPSHSMGHNHHFPEAEPLLRPNPNVCPRHGPKPMPPARNDNQATASRGSGMEEIQV